MTENLHLKNQDELLEKLKSLPEEKQKLLLGDILTQDFEKLDSLVQNANKDKENAIEKDEILPLPFPHSEHDLRREMWKETGQILINKGAIGAITLAGGQGSRLGFDGPKGIFDFGLPSKSSLFALQAKKILRLSAEASRPIPWCIMTSPLNHEATVRHFEENKYFGLDRNFVRFFMQGTICALSPEGKALIENDRLVLVPDGNGGCFHAFVQNGLLAWFIELNIRYVFLCNIDNALIQMCDPVFLGAFASGKQTMATAKVVAKRDASEKVGIFVYKNKKTTVLEYSEMPEKLSNMKTPDGELIFDGANIGIYAFKIEALKKMQKTPLPWHLALKTINGIPNCMKFEQFLFDAFSSLTSFSTFGVVREEEFAPIKNASGNDSPESARKMIGRLHKEWLEKSGVSLNNDKLYEISPALSYAGEGLSESVFKRELGKNIFEFSL